MSISNRVNIFLERARQLSSSSPKPLPNPRSPLRSEDNSLRSITPKQVGRPISLSKTHDIITDLESMIDDFLRSRCSLSKKLESHKVKELKVISELKKTLDSEMLRSKALDFQALEQIYKEKTDKVLMIVKQEALAVDKKLMELKEENSRLRQRLSELNIEAIDRKISEKVMRVEEVVSRLSLKETGGFKEGLRELLAMVERPEEVWRVVEGREDRMIPEICGKISRVREKRIRTKKLENEEIRVKRELISRLRQKVQEKESKCVVVIETDQFDTFNANLGFVDEIFLATDGECDDAINASDILNKIYDELIEELD